MTQNYFSKLSPKPVHLDLVQDRIRDLKRGYPWVFAHSVAKLPDALSGSLALLKDKEGEIVARGIYDPKCPIIFRVCTLDKVVLDDEVIKNRLERAVRWRETLFADSNTTAYRLINGEGDGLPGLVCDVYGKTAVMNLDGEGPAGFWQIESIAKWLQSRLDLETVYYLQGIRKCKLW